MHRWHTPQDEAQELIEESRGRVPAICDLCEARFRLPPNALERLERKRWKILCPACGRKVQRWIKETSPFGESPAMRIPYDAHPGWSPMQIGHWFDMHPIRERY